MPLIGKGAIENALKKRQNKPILLIDLGVPRNIEEEIRNIEQAYLFSIDDIAISTPFQIDFDKNQIIEEGFVQAFNQLILSIITRNN